MVVGPIARAPLARAPGVVAPVLPRVAQFRNVETIAYPGSAASTRTKIPRDWVLQDLNLFVSGTLAIGVADATALRSEQPFSIIREVRVEGASGIRQVGEIKKMDGPAAFRLQHILLGTPGINTPVSGVTVAGSPYNWSFDLRIDFHLTKADRAWDTLLKGSELNSLDLVIDWGAGTDLVNPAGTTTLTLTVTQAVLGIREMRDPVSMGLRYKIHRVGFIEQVPSGASTAFKFDLRGRNTLRGILIKQFTQAAGVFPHTTVDSIINSLQLKLDGDVREDWNPEDALRAENKINFSVETMPVGYLFLDLLHGGHRELELNTNRFTSVDLLFNVASVADGKIRVYPVEIVP